MQLTGRAAGGEMVLWAVFSWEVVWEGGFAAC